MLALVLAPVLALVLVLVLVLALVLVLVRAPALTSADYRIYLAVQTHCF